MFSWCLLVFAVLNVCLLCWLVLDFVFGLIVYYDSCGFVLMQVCFDCGFVDCGVLRGICGVDCLLFIDCGVVLVVLATLRYGLCLMVF